ncbi:MAG: hypothetical protein ABR521_14330 [Gaiellaceae bacterium]
MNRGPRPGERAPLDRIYAAVPILLVFVWLSLLYAWESSHHGTPWLFGDELQLAQLSRSIAETGEPALRGAPHGFQSLYSYVLAPVWWIDDVHTAYDTVKYLGVLVMTASAFPAYALARLLVGRPAALFAGAATASIPALVYSPMLIPEPLAYPYALLCFFLIVKALAVRGRGWIAGAAVACAIAPAVRGELALVPVVFGLAAFFLFWQSERMRRWRAGWSAGDWIGLVVLGLGALIVFNTLIGHRSVSWDIATGHYKQRMFEYGLWAAGALTIGLGVLPVVAGLAALVRPRDEPRTPALRAFVAVTAASILCFGLYTAVKASYISTVFSTRVVERNLIYVAPLLLVGTALWLERPRLRRGALAGAAVFAYYVLVTTPYQLEFRFYSDAPGLAILQMANRNLAFTPETAKWVLRAALLVAVLLLLLPGLLRRHRRAARAVATLAAGLVLAWSLAGQISASNASNAFSDQFLRGFPRQTDWVDRATKGAPTLYLGQNLEDPNGLWSLEFWNRSIRYVWSLDGTAPGPGPTETPNVDRTDGHLQQQRGELKYVLAEPGIDVVGKEVATAGYLAAGSPALWRLIRIDYPVRLRHAQAGIYSDGWMGERAAYTEYRSPGDRAGWITVNVSREAWGGTDVPGKVTVRVGRLSLGPKLEPRIGEVTGLERWTIHSHLARRFVLPTPPPPFRVEVTISPTFVPQELDPRLGDRRQLGAIVAFGFSERRPAAGTR